jgi:branched-chain amino acid transport system substrate-binding protein
MHPFALMSLFLFSISLYLPYSFAETGVSDKEVVIGTTNVQSGSAADLGLELNNGAKAYIDKINKVGGVNGRNIKWIIEDDGYEPAVALEKTKKLIEKEKVFCLFNTVGTPTANAILPTLARLDVPLIGAFTGAEVLRNPAVKNVFNIRSSYWDEAEVMIANAVDLKGMKKVAIFMQDDSFGTAVSGGVIKALMKRGIKPVASGKFSRNSEDVDAGLKEITKSVPDVVVMAGTAKPLALFVKRARKNGLHPIFFTVSFVGSTDFARELGEESAAVFVTQVVPDPKSSSLPVVKKARADLAAIGAKPSYGALEGYLNAMVLVEGLKAAGPDLTRDSFRTALESLHKDLDGFKIEFGPTNHQASSSIFLTKISGGKVVPISNID